MKILILGGDKRYHQLIKNLVDKNTITLVGYKTIFNNCIYKDINEIDASLYDFIILPVNGIGNNNKVTAEEEFIIPNDFFENVNKNTYIISGINTPSLKQLLKNRPCIFIMNDKDVIKENAIPTVEGIISNLIENTDITINSANIMIIGYGNIGTYLTSILRSMGANIIVSIIDKKDIGKLEKENIKYLFSNDFNNMSNILQHMDMIINTAPSLVINENYIKCLNKEVYILDVSSYPHGIDKNILDINNIKNNIYLGIPSKVAPKTSGLILTKKINKILGGK